MKFKCILIQPMTTHAVENQMTCTKGWVVKDKVIEFEDKVYTFEDL